MNNFKMKYSFYILNLKKKKKDNLDMPTNIGLNSKLIIKTNVVNYFNTMTYSMFPMW